MYDYCYNADLGMKAVQTAMVASVWVRMEKGTWEMSSGVQSPTRKLSVASPLQLIHPNPPKYEM